MQVQARSILEPCAVRMLEGAQGSVHLIPHQPLNSLGVFLGDFPRHVEVLVFLLAQPTQGVGVDETGAGFVGSIGALALRLLRDRLGCGLQTDGLDLARLDGEGLTRSATRRHLAGRRHLHGEPHRPGGRSGLTRDDRDGDRWSMLSGPTWRFP